VQSTLGRVLADLVTLYIVLLFARAILDLVLSMNRSARPSGAWVPVFEFVYTVMDPPLRLLRRIIPPLRIGNVAFDLGFTVLVIALFAIRATLLTRI
jgi:YggT family protein